MRRVVIFGTPKEFTEVGDTSQRQYNAIKSWTLLKPRPVVVLFHGNTGTAAVSRMLGGINAYVNTYQNVPLVSDMFEVARNAFPDDILLYINSDIVVPQALMDALAIVEGELDQFMMVGQRWNYEQDGRIDFRNDDWIPGEDNGWLDPSVCIDYFAFTYDAIDPAIPPFAVGYYGWDAWLIWSASQRVPLVDVTDYALVYHQDHSSNRISRTHPIAKRNRAFLPQGVYDVKGEIGNCATHKLAGEGSEWNLRDIPKA
jgi:hypothetical protein